MLQVGSLSLTCHAESSPASAVSWLLGGAVVQTGPSLKFSPVTREQAGTYQCRAENTVGISPPANYTLDVECK